MAIPQLQETLDAMTDTELVPVPPTPPPDNTWTPGPAALRIIVGLFKQGVEKKWGRGEIFKYVIDRAWTQYAKTIVKSQLQEIWEAWQAEISTRA
jgi:hypothetical protein